MTFSLSYLSSPGIQYPLFLCTDSYAGIQNPPFFGLKTFHPGSFFHAGQDRMV